MKAKKQNQPITMKTVSPIQTKVVCEQLSWQTGTLVNFAESTGTPPRMQPQEQSTTSKPSTDETPPAK